MAKKRELRLLNSTDVDDSSLTYWHWQKHETALGFSTGLFADLLDSSWTHWHWLLALIHPSWTHWHWLLSEAAQASPSSPLRLWAGFKREAGLDT